MAVKVFNVPECRRRRSIYSGGSIYAEVAGAYRCRYACFVILCTVTLPRESTLSPSCRCVE